MTQGILKIATCQFPVCDNVEANGQHIQALMRQAADKGAHIAHFSECAISGYAGVDFGSFDGYDWDLLRNRTLEIIRLAGELRLWVVLGSAHPLTAPHKPHNCLYLISPEGKLANRYDKRFCTSMDLDHFTPGDHFAHFEINGVKCSLLICFDLRFPELYRQLYRNGVKCVFQSFYNARQQGPSVHSDIMRQTMQANAANNGFWVSMSNSCGWFCPYPSCFIQPDGRIAGQLAEHREGLMIHAVDLNEDFYDPAAPFRNLAIAGRLNNAPERIVDPRSADTSEL
ncbi:MAG: carbon-nitrogen hydrolase family protein [Planctomycetaceae bacterium]|nr:carbon-nitrogen hydrolase family protein [Planctomycetaceae bacterium]